MKKILVGVKHREALESIRIINYFQEKNNWSVKFSLIAFFELSKEESEAISKEGIKFISADWQLPFIKRDGVNAKIIKLYKTYLTYKIFRNNLEKDYEGILISPGSFLLDQLVAFAIDNNIPSYVLQSGFIAPIEKEEKKKENINYLYRILAKFSGFFSSRLKLKENVDYPILLTFGKEYSEYLNCIPETTIKSISVGSPRFFELEKESVGKINYPPKVLYLTSSALYENEFKLHEMIKLQVTELIEKVDSQIIELHLRPHPRDNFNWEKDSLSDYIKIIDNSSSVLEQIQEYDFVIAERSTVVLQAIFLGKIGFWVTLDEKRKYAYDFICHENIDEMLSDIMTSIEDKDYYLSLHRNQKKILKTLVEATGEEAAYKILRSVIGPITTPTSATNFVGYLDYLRLIKNN